MAREGVPLGVAVIRRVGWRDGGTALGMLWAWSVWLQTHDMESPPVVALMGTTKRSRASWYRDMDAFRNAFPGEESPDRIARLVVAAVGDRKLKSSADLIMLEVG